MRRSTAVRLLRPWVRIPPEAWMLVVCCVLSGRGLCDGLITRPEESYRLWCVVVCDQETSWMRRPRHTRGLSRQEKNIIINIQWDDVIKDEIYSWGIPPKKHTQHLNTGRSNCVKPGKKISLLIIGFFLSFAVSCEGGICSFPGSRNRNLKRNK